MANSFKISGWCVNVALTCSSHAESVFGSSMSDRPRPHVSRKSKPKEPGRVARPSCHDPAAKQATPYFPFPPWHHLLERPPQLLSTLLRRSARYTPNLGRQHISTRRAPPYHLPHLQISSLSALSSFADTETLSASSAAPRPTIKLSKAAVLISDVAGNADEHTGAVAPQPDPGYARFGSLYCLEHDD